MGPAVTRPPQSCGRPAFGLTVVDGRLDEKSIIGVADSGGVLGEGGAVETPSRASPRASAWAMSWVCVQAPVQWGLPHRSVGPPAPFSGASRTGQCGLPHRSFSRGLRPAGLGGVAEVVRRRRGRLAALPRVLVAEQAPCRAGGPPPHRGGGGGRRGGKTREERGR